MNGTRAATDVVAPPAVDHELPPRVIMASLAGIVAVMLLAALDGTIVGTAMPRIIAELDGFNHYAAVTTAYMLAATVPVPIVGKLSDLYGRKPFLLLGVAIFVIGSALCGAATSMTGLIAARALQGIGGGISQGMAFTTVADLFPPTRRGRVTGVLGSVFGLASVIGPAVGGFLTDGPGWRWCFLVNLPIGVVAFATLYYFFPHMVAVKERRRVDWLGAVTMVLAVVPILLALSWGGQDYPWSAPLILGLLAGGAVMGALFIWLQLRTPDPIMPPALFKNRVVWTASVAATLVAIGMFGALLFIPLFIQTVIGRSAAESGAVTTPMMFCLIGASMAAGQRLTKVGKYKSIAVFGVSLTTLGMVLLSLMTADTSYTTVLVNMMVLGTGLGMTMPVFNIAVQNAVSYSQLGVATSSLTFLRSIGGSLGASLFGAILSNRYPAALHAAIPLAAITVPPALLATVENPQALMNPKIAASIPAPVARIVQGALASSLHEMFIFGTVIVALSIVFALLLVDIPLRSSNRAAPAPDHI
jgi:EmrB/QacA subfamily drug resistance transporter